MGRVAAWIQEGLNAGDAVVVVATIEHILAFSRALEAAGVDPAELGATGRLCVQDAREALAGFLADGLPDRTRYLAFAGPILDAAGRVSRSGEIRVFGEMAELLWREGNAAGGAALRALWSEALAERGFSLIRADSVDGFPGHEHAIAFRASCSWHGASRPAVAYDALPEDERRLRSA